MKRAASLFAVLALVVAFAQSTRAQDPNAIEAQKVPTVTMALTSVGIDDQSLQLSWRIRNDTDHDVWICHSMTGAEGQFHERFLDADNQTFVLRRRFDLAMQPEALRRYPPLQSRYVCLGPGQEKAESLSLDLPAFRYRLSEGECGTAERATRLALEIGFYDEDLPGLILQIVEFAEKIHCDLDVGAGDLTDIAERFFGGWSIAMGFKHLLGFSGSVLSDDGKVTIPYMGPVLNGEKVLRIEVNGVDIPYRP